jgi:short-subunit dehydrogenase
MAYKWLLQCIGECCRDVRVGIPANKSMRRITMPNKPSVLITGASTGIGAVYADRFAKRGHDLILVARDQVRLETLADRLRRETAVAVDILRADLTDPRDLAQVEAWLRDDHSIGVLVNNAGTAPAGALWTKIQRK